MKKLSIFAIVNLLVLATTASAQNIIKGKITGNSGEPVAFAFVLVQKNDSAKQDAAKKIADSAGNYQVQIKANGNYILRVSAVGYKETGREITLTESETRINITMEEADANLKDVTITSHVPEIKRNASGYNFEIENTFLATGNDLNSLLPLLPGIMVDDQNGIRTLTGKSVLLMIDNRTIKLPADQLQSYLNTIRSENIKSIEVINHPSAAYDAEGVGGVVKIILKNHTDNGISGSVSEKYMQGKYPKNEVAANVTAGLGKVMLYGGVSENSAKNFGEIYTFRENTNSSAQQGITQNVKTISNTYTANAGLRYAINPKSSFAFDATYGHSNYHRKNSDMTSNLYENNVLDSVIKSTILPFTMRSDNFSLSANYQLTTDTLSSNLTITSDYLYSKNNSYYLYSNNYYLPDNSFLGNTAYDNSAINKVGIFSFKIDRNRNFTKKTSLSYGVKFADANTAFNNLTRDSLSANNWIADPTMTDNLGYKEDIYAGYASLNTHIKKIELTAGLRAEYTHYSLISHTADTTAHNHYLNWFPNLSLLIPVNNKKQSSVNISYNKSIMRPNYEILNPFVYRQDLYTLKEGNPNLKPSIFHTLSAAYNFNNNYSVSLSYNIQNSMISDVEKPDTGNMMIETFGNVDKVHEWDLSGNTMTQIGKWWTMIWQIDLYAKKFVDPNIAVQNAVGLTFANIDMFRISPTWNVRLTTQFFTKGQDRFYRINKNFAFSALEIDKQLGSFQLKAGVNDIFNASQGNMSITYNYQTQRNLFNIKRDTRYAFISVTYSFKKGKQVRKTDFQKSNAEESRRVGN